MIKLLVLLMLIVPVASWAACGTPCTKVGTTYTCTDSSYDCVNDAVTAATAEDTIELTADATWGSILSIYKAITLKGIENPTITKSGVAVYYNPASTSAALRFEISGIIFTGGIRLNDNENDGAPYSPLYDTRGTAKNSIVIGNNTFATIYVQGDFRGVVYNNVINGASVQIQNMGSNITTFNAFDDDLAFGTSGMMYYEDNTFTGTIEIATSNGSGGRWAWRYNTFSGTPSGGFPVLDTHGCQESGNPGGMLHEVYGNILSFTNDPTWMRQRGGRVLMFNNRSSAGVGTIWQDDEFDPGTYCVTETPGIVSPNASYYFNNWAGSVLKSCSINLNDFSHLGANVSVWNYNSNTLNGSTEKGINCGSATPSSSCSTGDAYWKTTASPCSTPPATLADMRTYTQAGTLYKCTSPNTWEVSYTPYTYPHPLREEEEEEEPATTRLPWRIN